MNRATSLYLDAVRFAAALTVFLSHFATRWASGGLLWQLEPLGGDAVVVFFVLSGFVIDHAAARPGLTGRDYALARVARLYSVCVPAIALTYGLEALGLDTSLDPAACGLCQGPGHFGWQLANALLFTGQLWFAHVPLGANVPYWSLGYEVPYYILFGVAVFLPRPWAQILVLLALAAMGPNIASLLPLWLLGVACHRRATKHPPGVKTGLALWLGSALLLALVLFPPVTRYQVYDDLSLAPDRLRDLLHVYAVGTLFALHILGMTGAAPILARGLEALSRPIRWCGGRTFALYLFHVPLLHLAVGLLPWPPAAWPTRLAILVTVPAASLALAGLTEQKRDSWRRLFARLI